MLSRSRQNANGKEIKLSLRMRKRWSGGSVLCVLLLPRTYPIFKYEYARVPTIHNLAQLCSTLSLSVSLHLDLSLTYFVGGLFTSLYDKPHSIFHFEFDVFACLDHCDVCGVHTHFKCTGKQIYKHSNHLHPNFEVPIEPRWIIAIIIKKCFRVLRRSWAAYVCVVCLQHFLWAQWINAHQYMCRCSGCTQSMVRSDQFCLLLTAIEMPSRIIMNKRAP